MTTDKTTTRCFLACWPDQAVADYLEELTGVLQKQAAGRKVRRRNIHVTLAFLGGIVPTQVAAVAEHCPAMPGPLTLRLDRIGYWKRGGIVWAGSRIPDPEFMAWADEVRGSLRRLGFRLDSRPFVPHLTLLRNARKRPRVEIVPTDWTLSEYTLVASELTPAGSKYSILKRWSTRGDVE